MKIQETWSSSLIRTAEHTMAWRQSVGAPIFLPVFPKKIAE
jgi:hypothetical protein